MTTQADIQAARNKFAKIDINNSRKHPTTICQTELGNIDLSYAPGDRLYIFSGFNMMTQQVWSKRFKKAAALIFLAAQYTIEVQN